MTIPSISLTPLVMTSPTLPAGVTSMSVDASTLAFSILADLNTLAIDITVGGVLTSLTNPTVVAGSNQFTGEIPVPVNSAELDITGRSYSLTDTNPTNPRLTPTISFTLIPYVSEYGILIGPPTGVTSSKGATNAQIEWALPTYAGFLGVLVEWSTDRTGVNPAYQPLTTGLVTEITRTAYVPITSSTTTSTAPPVDGYTTSQQTQITNSTVAQVNYSSVQIPYSTINADIFYVRLSVMVQNPSTSLIYQSRYVGPILAGFTDIRQTNPSDFLALQRSSDIASRMITEMTRRQPNLDLTPRAELRDTVVNTVALELANMSFRQWFAECSRSVTAMLEIDDANGDGQSDPVATSTIKLQIAQQYGLSQTDTQTFIDKRFDILGEAAGLPRGGATTATVPLTFYTYSQPTRAIVVSVGATASSQSSPTTASVTFATTASGTIDPTSSYDPANGWWAVTLPSQCTVSGSTGNVGEGAVNQVLSGGPSGVAVVNLVPVSDGTDQESNSDYGVGILNYVVTGKDTSSRGGLLKIARSIPGASSAQIVGANDLEMLRDWDSVRGKHVFGCVDIYLRGETVSQQSEDVPFILPSTSTYGDTNTYLNLQLTDPTNLKFSIKGFNTLTPLYTVVELIASNIAGSFYLGTDNAQIDNVGGVIVLSPGDIPYTINADGTTAPMQINGAAATNLHVIQALTAQGSATFFAMARYATGLQHIPALQPLIAVDSVAGPVTGNVASQMIQLVRTEDFLLNGGSNLANDTVNVQNLSQLKQQTITLATTVTPIDTDMDVTISTEGTPGNIVSLRSGDQTTLYVFGLDYSIVPNGRYRSYSLQILNDVTTGQPRIATGATLLLAYNKFPLTENLTLQTDTLLLSGTAATSLSQEGFVYNTWLPLSHGLTTLVLDGYNANPLLETGLMGAAVAPSMRYIKVTLNGAVMQEGRDFQLIVNSSTGAATLARVFNGSIPDGSSVVVTYFYAEVFTVSTQYPTYVQQLVTKLAPTQAAASSVLVKAKVPNPVDITVLVTLDANTSPSTIDARIRTTVGLILDGSETTLPQAAIISSVFGLTGVTNVPPLVKCAKSDGSYSIAEVVPTGTTWTPLSTDTNFTGLTLPTNSFISASPLLQNPTVPSGGPSNAYVGMLYQGEPYRRAMSVADFLSSSTPSFYLIGTNDAISPTKGLNSTYSGKILINPASTVTNPSLLSFFVTYQVFGAAGAKDISTSSTEYLVPGTVTVLYAGGS
jgi:hypothetical protein